MVLQFSLLYAEKATGIFGGNEKPEKQPGRAG
jgi:hypothetical protein